MQSNIYRALACKISRGGFSDERTFTLDLSSGQHVGIASRRYFWTESGAPLPADEPPPGKIIDGFVAARVIRVDGNEVLVSIPDGEVVNVSVNDLVDRPSGSMTNVPV